jgi:hypothetical protein
MVIESATIGGLTPTTRRGGLEKAPVQEDGREMRTSSRIWIIGGPGAGKSTLGQCFASFSGLPLIELDALYWGPFWTRSSTERFRQDLELRISGPAWIVDGIYPQVNDLIAARAGTVIWIECSVLKRTWRVLCRSLHRIWHKTRLWNGNCETWKSLLGRSSMPLYALTRCGLHGRVCRSIFRNQEERGGLVYRFSSRVSETQMLDLVKNICLRLSEKCPDECARS